MLKNISFSGIIKEYDHLEEIILPSNSYKFKNSDSVERFLIKAYITAIMVTVVFVILSKAICAMQNCKYEGANHYSATILLLWILQLIPHEIIHALFYGKDAKASIYVDLKHFMLLCYSVSPISKRRFIVMSLMPTMFFGIIPYLFWAFWLVRIPSVGNYLLSYCVFPLIAGSGDILNVIDVVREVPSNGYIVFSGGKGYWYKDS